MAVFIQSAPLRMRRSALHLAVAGAFAASVGYAATVDARLVKFEVTSKESPTFGGYSFAGVGQYEKLVGMAYGELNPNDPRNAVIVDIKLAPRNASVTCPSLPMRAGLAEWTENGTMAAVIEYSSGAMGTSSPRTQW